MTRPNKLECLQPDKFLGLTEYTRERSEPTQVNPLVLFCPGRLQPYSQILGKARKPFRSSTLASFASKAGAYTSGVLYVALLPGQAPGLSRHNARLNTLARSLEHSTLSPEISKLEELMVPHSVDKLLTLLANI
jgi:hypothetical protein